MSVRARILLSLLFVSGVFGAAIWLLREDQALYFNQVREIREKDWRQSVVQFLQRHQRPPETTVRDFAADQPLIAATGYQSRDELAKLLDDRALRARDLHAAWVYLADGRLLFAHSLSTASQVVDGEALPGVDVAAMVAARREPYFHFELPGAAPGAVQRRFFAVRGTPIIGQVEAAGGREAIVGYLFAGRILDQDEVSAMPLLHQDDHIQLVAAMVTPPSESQITMSHSVPLRDWRDRVIGQLLVWNNSRELDDLATRNEQQLILLVVGGLALFTTLFFALSRSIVRPLGTMTRALDDGDAAALQPLAQQRSEFGALAQLIRDHIEQSSKLVREMQLRAQTQEALRESDEMLRHSQKLEAVGRLAGGVAHDFNNLLTAIIGYASLLQQRLAEQPALREHADLIHQAGEQAAGLTRQLLAFSRKQLLQPRLIDLNAIVSNLHRLLQRIIGEHIVIVTDPRSATGCVSADPGQVEQVIVNLGVNARDAMPRGGKLTIRTVDVQLDGSAADLDVPAGDYVALEVTDTGEGMDPETKQRLFEPFFTTKGPGKGTGLGLATVYGIVKQSGGAIGVESERGRGSTFRIFLPLQSGTPEGQQVVSVRETKKPCTETVLVVEDEEIVRELVCEVLTAEGYRVRGTDRGSEGVRLAREELAGVDLLISDVIMPEMNGAVVARRIREIAPRAKVLFVSGYSESDMADQGLETLTFEVLQKPFTPTTLARKVREVLDAEARP